jgi:hypothetical protein
MMETSRSDSPEDTYFAEGERQIGIQICNALKINIEEQFKIFYEQQGE